MHPSERTVQSINGCHFGVSLDSALLRNYCRTNGCHLCVSLDSAFLWRNFSTSRACAWCPADLQFPSTHTRTRMHAHAPGIRPLPASVRRGDFAMLSGKSTPPRSLRATWALSWSINPRLPATNAACEFAGLAIVVRAGTKDKSWHCFQLERVCPFIMTKVSSKAWTVLNTQKKSENELWLDATMAYLLCTGIWCKRTVHLEVLAAWSYTRVRKPGTISAILVSGCPRAYARRCGLSEPFEFARGLSVSQPDQGRGHGAHAGHAGATPASSSSSCRSPLEAAAWRGSRYRDAGWIGVGLACVSSRANKAPMHCSRSRSGTFDHRGKACEEFNQKTKKKRRNVHWTQGRLKESPRYEADASVNIEIVRPILAVKHENATDIGKQTLATKHPQTHLCLSALIRDTKRRNNRLWSP